MRFIRPAQPLLGFDITRVRNRRIVDHDHWQPVISEASQIEAMMEGWRREVCQFAIEASRSVEVGSLPDVLQRKPLRIEPVAQVAEISAQTGRDCIAEETGPLQGLTNSLERR